MIQDNQVELRAVRTLFGKRFYIPSYQRGYRWGKKQVIQLLDDLLEFEQEKEGAGKFYCLQPIVVAPLLREKYLDTWELTEEPVYEVIDGQQRLTTILLILQFLKEKNLPIDTLYSVHYETRETSEDFLSNIKDKSLEKAEANADYWHLYHAYKTIEQWFGGKGNQWYYPIFQLLNNGDEQRNTRIIWYIVLQHEERINVFNRLNIGKIPLTEAELIRALFLRQGNFGSSAPTLEQEQIANTWDDIERKLQRSSFWCFLHGGNLGKTYASRIDLLFELVTAVHTGQCNPGDSFEYFSGQLNSAKADSRKVWLKVKQCFLRLEEWYDNHELYHYIGYLVTTGARLQDLYKLSEGKGKTVFTSLLKERIRLGLNDVNLSELTYGEGRDRDKIRRVLLLFNIVSILSAGKEDMRFPFDRYQEGSWDVEHIRSQKEYKKTTHQHKILEASRDYYKTKLEKQDEEQEDKQSDNIIISLDEERELLKDIEQLLEDMQTPKIAYQERFNEVFARLQKALGEDKELDNMHGLGNLALLNSTTNRGYGNSPFVLKRLAIIDNDKQAIFTPLATKNVFLKYYSPNASDLLVWSEEDAANYFAAIKNMLAPYVSE